MTELLQRSATPSVETDRLAVDTLRFLAADMVQAANSGHPGMPMGAAPMAWTLWSRHLRHDPSARTGPTATASCSRPATARPCCTGCCTSSATTCPRPSCATSGSWGRARPGHPEFGHTAGVECTTGPLGQGLAMAVGMALAERMPHARYPEITDHHTYAIVGDGCLMEGVSHEAASLAGHLGLGRLIVLWDDNSITIDGAVDRSCSDDQLARFAAYGWHTRPSSTAPTSTPIDAAIARAKADPRPSFIAVRTVIGHGAPGVEGTSKAHGSPLGEERARRGQAAGRLGASRRSASRSRCGLPALRWRGRRREHAAWQEAFAAFEAGAPAAGSGVPAQSATAHCRTASRMRCAQFAGDAPRATRQSSQACLKAADRLMPELVGGSADLAGSTGTAIGGAVVTRDDYSGSAIAFGIREFGMAAVMNGHQPARRVPALRQHLPGVRRLPAPGAAARGADAAAGHLRAHPRLDRGRRGRPDPPAGRADRVPASDPGTAGAAPGRRRRDGRGLAARARADRRADRPDPVPPDAAPARRPGRLASARPVAVEIVATGSEVALAAAGRRPR